MSEFKGTKGLWKYEIKFGKNRPRITVQIPIRKDYNQELILGIISQDDCTVSSCCCIEAHANAKLIAHAPEMLEMLQYFVRENMLSIAGEEMAEQLIQKATTPCETK
jgi:hypothetical protein